MFGEIPPTFKSILLDGSGKCTGRHMIKRVGVRDFGCPGTDSAHSESNR